MTGSHVDSYPQPIPLRRHERVEARHGYCSNAMSALVAAAHISSLQKAMQSDGVPSIMFPLRILQGAPSIGEKRTAEAQGLSEAWRSQRVNCPNSLR